MKPEEIKARLDRLARVLLDASRELEGLSQYFHMDCDRREASSIITDLRWATENCTVIGLHQIVKAMEDKMRVTERFYLTSRK